MDDWFTGNDLDYKVKTWTESDYIEEHFVKEDLQEDT
jgi:hypothetical protein